MFDLCIDVNRWHDLLAVYLCNITFLLYGMFGFVPIRAETLAIVVLLKFENGDEINIIFWTLLFFEV